MQERSDNKPDAIYNWNKIYKLINKLKTEKSQK